MAERSGRIINSRRMTPDIIVETHNTAVIIETEYHPAVTLQNDVDRVFGKEIEGVGIPSAIIGVVLPAQLKKYYGKDLFNILKSTNTFEYFIKYANGDKFPSAGNLVGSLSDIIAG